MSEKNDPYLNKIQEILKSGKALESQLETILDQMEEAIKNEGNPHLAHFWQAKKYVAELFQKEIPEEMKNELRDRYSKLIDEAKRLKAIIEDQSSFAVEQIEIALKALEEQIQTIKNECAKSNFSFSPKSWWLEKNEIFYLPRQIELNLLNAMASRVHSLRKELSKLQLRYKQKNQLFQRLSGLGDKIFPRRKELIKEVSEAFQKDVLAFFKEKFSPINAKDRMHNLRDEIKALQSAAKQLTLNTNAFNHTRRQLSECWEKLKELEKEKKRQFAEKSEEFKKNSDQLRERLEEIKAAFASEETNLSEKQELLKKTFSELRSLHLDRKQKSLFKEELDRYAKRIQEKLDTIKEKQIEEGKKKAAERAKDLDTLTERVENLAARAVEQTFAHFLNEVQDIEEQIFSLSLEKQEVEGFSHQLTQVKGEAYSNFARAYHKDWEVQGVIPEDFDALSEEILEYIQVLRELSEESRKASGASGMDFDQALVADQRRQELKELSHLMLEAEELLLEINASLAE